MQPSPFIPPYTPSTHEIHYTPPPPILSAASQSQLGRLLLNTLQSTVTELF
jgi:hypothetical protein